MNQLSTEDINRLQEMVDFTMRKAHAQTEIDACKMLLEKLSIMLGEFK